MNGEHIVFHLDMQLHDDRKGTGFRQPFVDAIESIKIQVWFMVFNDTFNNT